MEKKEVNDLVFGFLDNNVEPHAQIRGDHVHQTEISDDLVLPN